MTSTAVAIDTNRDPGVDLGTSTTGTKTVLPADLSVHAVMAKDLVIPREDKSGSFLNTVREGDRAAAIEVLVEAASKAPAGNVSMRWAGGCKGFDASKVEDLFQFIAAGSVSEDGERCFKGAVGSGGTIDFGKDGKESFMICQVPMYLARLTPCIAWSSTPETARLRLSADNGQVLVSKYGALLDHRGHINLLTENAMGASYQGWDGDVRLYIEALEACKKHGYNVAVGVVNGGDVTKDEALLALSKGIPVIIIAGSGRASDELVTAIRAGTLEDVYNNPDTTKRGLINLEKDKVPTKAEIEKLAHIVDFGDVAGLRATNEKLGLLT